jgi:hypothetical protein
MVQLELEGHFRNEGLDFERLEPLSAACGTSTRDTTWVENETSPTRDSGICDEELSDKNLFDAPPGDRRSEDDRALFTVYRVTRIGRRAALGDSESDSQAPR